MSFEDRLRDSLRSRAERAEASADAYDRIVQRVEPRSPRAWLAPAVAVGGVAAAVVLVVALVTGGDDGRGVAAGPQAVWSVSGPAGGSGLDARQVARAYLGEHDVPAEAMSFRRGHEADDPAGAAEAAVVGYEGGWVNVARAEYDAAVWVVVSAHDSRIPIVDARRRGARVDIEFDAIVADVVVTARVGSPARDWLAETTVDLKAGRSQRLVLDVGRDAPDPLLVQIRTTDASDFVGLTELLVE